MDAELFFVWRDAVRWSYKTIHFGLKKDGLLGSAFLDDAEIEETLNEYGQGGWELVSILETRDGVLAVFKQPLEYSSGKRTESQLHRPEKVRDAAPSAVAAMTGKKHPRDDEEQELKPEPEPDFQDKPETEERYPAVKKYPDRKALVVDAEDDDEEDSDSGIGAIRIE